MVHIVVDANFLRSAKNDSYCIAILNKRTTTITVIITISLSLFAFAAHSAHSAEGRAVRCRRHEPAAGCASPLPPQQKPLAAAGEGQLHAAGPAGQAGHRCPFGGNPDLQFTSS